MVDQAFRMGWGVYLHSNFTIFGDQIIIQEKIDGASFSIRYDAGQDIGAAFSRKCELDFENNMCGALQWVQELTKELVRVEEN